MFPWSDAREPAAPAYAVGDPICSADTGPADTCRGCVVSVDAEQATMGVVWSDGDGGAITYPIDATYLRKAMPWES